MSNFFLELNLNGWLFKIENKIFLFFVFANNALKRF